jgi:acyl-CoA thioesterase FadM
MNNSRFLALMDVGRYHLVLVSGLGRELMLRRGWRPVLVRAAVDFKSSLKPGDRFVLETQMERVGTKSSVLVQRFWKGDKLVAEGRATAVFLKEGKTQDVSHLLEEFAYLMSGNASRPKAGGARDDVIEVPSAGSPGTRIDG